LILAHSSITVPFGVWLMWQYFQTIPMAYQESAYTLGAGSLRTLIEVEVPLARSGIAAVAIFAFALSWEDYTMSFILSRDASAQTLPVILGQFSQRYAVDWGAASAAAVVLAIPSLIIVIFLQRFLVRGVGMGGVK
jgi:multiple sugar transport system permease protein